MNAKRKIEEGVNSNGKKQLSAFAAAQAYRDVVQDGNNSESERSLAEADPDNGKATPRLSHGEYGARQSYEHSDLETENEDNSSTIREPMNHALSSWTPREIWKDEPNAVTRIAMEPNECVTLIGQYDLSVTTGAVMLYGAKLEEGPTKYRVFAPSTHAIPSIRCLNESCVVSIRSCDHTMRPLEKLSPLFSRIWNYRPKVTQRDGKLENSNFTFCYIQNTADDPLKRPLVPVMIHPGWFQTLQKIEASTKQQTPKILVCGAKSTGKSTFSRVATNVFLTAPLTSKLAGETQPKAPSTVCFLDLDPGQPEFGPPGQVSLVHVRKPIFGPPLTHAFTDDSTGARLVRAHTLGAITPQDDPEHYMKCFEDLLWHYHNLRKQYPSCPLVVNCSGFIFGSGLEITTRIVRHSNVTDIVYLSSQRETTGIEETLRTAAEDKRFYRLSTQTTTVDTRTPADLRTMQNLSYFHQLGPVHGQLRWSATALSSQRSKIIHYGLENPDFLGILSIGEQPLPDFLSTVLEGCCVAITVIEDDATAEDISGKVIRTDHESIPFVTGSNSNIVYPPEPSKSRNLGLAIIKTIDVTDQNFELQTPISPLELDRVFRPTDSRIPRIVLIRGNFDIPGWSYTEQLYASHISRSKARGTLTAPPNLSIDIEDLSIDKSVLPDKYDLSSSDDDETQVPWVRKMAQGEVPAKTWKGQRRKLLR